MTNKHPMQPIVVADDGIVRFKQNKIVKAILDSGKLDLNEIWMMDFKKNDMEQFYQLIGYSIDGFADVFGGAHEIVKKADKIVKKTDKMKRNKKSLK